MDLYPLKFYPILKERIWGGARLETLLGKNLEGRKNIGECWEISAVEENLSVVSNGYLEGNDLQDLIEIYMGELLGEKVFDRFGLEFPLLIKYIDAHDDLSIQVHPSDEVAEERHHANGKTEMWYALEGEGNGMLINGFDKDTNQDEFLGKLEDNSLGELFHYEKVSKGDVFYIPAGRVHAIGKGNLLAEIQQTSDVTYRIFDYLRVDKEGKQRELHLDLALDVIDYSKVQEPRSEYSLSKNVPVGLVKCPYFETNMLVVDLPLPRDYYPLDSFVILMGVEGVFRIEGQGFDPETIYKGETVLIPASLTNLNLVPVNGETRILEIYIP